MEKCRWFNDALAKAPPAKRDVLARLDAGECILGDGGFVFALEKRGYVKAGPWTPEACIEEPEGVTALHNEFRRAGSDVMQTFTFYASEDKLSNRGNKAGAEHGPRVINEAACDLARSVANKDPTGRCMIAGGIQQTPTYLNGGGKAVAFESFNTQLDYYVEKGVDFMIAEYFEHIEECEWAIEACFAKGFKNVAANMCIGMEGDLHGHSVEECAKRMAAAGAQIVGLNCHFGPFELLDAMEKCKKGLEEGGYLDGSNGKRKVHMMVQPLAYMTPDCGKQGFIDLPEFPFALEPRVATRWEMQKYARRAYDMGIRYIGGCCGFEPYHMRACADELCAERMSYAGEPDGFKKWTPGAGGLALHTKPWVRARASKEYWDNLKPAFGRNGCPATSCPCNWNVTQGDDLLCQQQEETTRDELSALATKGAMAEIAAVQNTMQSV